MATKFRDVKEEPGWPGVPPGFEPLHNVPPPVFSPGSTSPTRDIKMSDIVRGKGKGKRKYGGRSSKVVSYNLPTNDGTTPPTSPDCQSSFRTVSPCGAPVPDSSQLSARAPLHNGADSLQRHAHATRNDEAGPSEALRCNVRGLGHRVQPSGHRDGRTWIEVHQDCKTFPGTRITRTISSIMQRNLEKFTAKFDDFDQEKIDQMWNAFQSTYNWAPESDGKIKELWKKTCRNRFHKNLHNGKGHHDTCEKDPTHSLKHKSWIPDELVPKYVEYWGDKERNFPTRSEKAKVNRKKAEDVTHIGGSTGSDDIRAQLAREKGCAPHEVLTGYVYLRNHAWVSKSTGERNWANAKAEAIYEKWEKLMEAHFQTSDQSTWREMPYIWLEACGGVRKNQVPGIGKFADAKSLGFEVHKTNVPRQWEGEKHIIAENIEETRLLRRENEKLKNHMDWMTEFMNKMADHNGFPRPVPPNHLAPLPRHSTEED